MCGQTYFDGLVKGLQTTISGGLAKLIWTACILEYHNRFCIAKTCESSRPRELPPQTLTDTDMNLSIHPAPIDQPTVPQIASAQT